MNKTCARCEKTVYPTEELKCLDKVWHKGCFKCQECGMTLNMRTYKGYGKLPYCEAHVPKAKPTTMAETPELRRIAENTRLQSNVTYHADFEKSKGKFTQVADDPETLRIKANTKIISNVAYHGDLEKKAQMEKQRQINENGELVEVSTDYHQQLDNYATEMLPSSPPPNLPMKSHYQTPAVQPSQPQQATAQTNRYQPPVTHQEQYYKQKYEDYSYQTHTQYPEQYQMAQNQQNQMAQNQHQNHQVAQTQHQNQMAQNQHQNQMAQNQHQNQMAQNQHQNQMVQNQHQNQMAQNQHQNQFSYGQMQQGYGSGQRIGRIQDYDPLHDGPRAPPNTQRASTTLIYNSTNDGRQRGAHQSHQVQQQQSRQIGRVTDMDPLANEVPRPASNHQNQRVFIAMYDYEANDSDEVSFREGDLISNVTSIDEGWMTGQVIRTGCTGMLPANYVELASSSALKHYAN